MLFLHTAVFAQVTFNKKATLNKKAQTIGLRFAFYGELTNLQVGVYQASCSTLRLYQINVHRPLSHCFLKVHSLRYHLVLLQVST